MKQILKTINLSPNFRLHHSISLRELLNSLAFRDGGSNTSEA
jgi:hypothetical protein